MSWVRDSLLIAGIGLGAGFLFVMYSLVANTTIAAVQNATSTVPQAVNAVTPFVTTLPASFDWIFALFYVALPLLAFSLSFSNLIPTFFYWAGMIITFGISILGIVIQDIWSAINSSPEIASVATTYPMANYILSNYSLYFMLVLILLGIGTYVKTRGNQSAGVGFA